MTDNRISSDAVRVAADLLGERDYIARAIIALERESGDRPLDVEIETLGNRMKGIRAARLLAALKIMVAEIDEHLDTLGVEPPP